MTTHVTIIGAGFCGTALVRELARQAQGARIRVSLVGVADTFGSGVAYGAARPEHLLNVRAKDLGIDPDEPGGFSDFLKLGEGGRLEFLPRLAYGDYLRSHLETAVEQAPFEVERIGEEAVAIERAPGGGFRIFLASGEGLRSDVVVLALGALPPQSLPGIGPRLGVHPRYIGWPWQGPVLEAIAPDARILVVGAGLTMVDVAATLAARGHRGTITAISRRGLAPQPHTALPAPSLELPPNVLRALREHDLAGVLRGVRQLMAVLDDWRRVIDALRPYLQPFWRGLGQPERARFLRHLRPYWEVARHRVAPEAYARLQILQKLGRLQIRAARLLRARLVEDGLEAVLRERGREQAVAERYDVLIRATGLDTDVDRTSDPLVSSLREGGLVRPDPLGLGLEVDPSLHVLDAAGAPVKGLYCVGPLLRGALWEITAVPELRVAARGLVRHLLEDAGGAANRREVHAPVRVVG
ncbi:MULTISPECIES: FAD/NAD(P)-binding protein [Gammaproteobacteria]|uniref:Pyridine nucleotide-disulfide oxidoreductase n=1 Tax=Xanthomonas boreopolis TaxID=86183 RepID=A0A919F8E9_9XANT|nr:FAD/NAD(P)-binding protein [Pseudomonas sp. Hp2]GHH54798.1 pyridine nucleotide-disulfide oxidoreductase [[Pseudomonas] boreopolis]